MRKSRSLSRREFVAGTSGLLMGGALPGVAAVGAEKTASSPVQSPLAVHGAEKTVEAVPSLPRRWGDPERQQLEEMLQQHSLFYWGGHRTRLLVERVREVCPLKYVHTCSSGTAAIHIAVAAAGIGPGDEVITTAVTDPGTVIGVLYQQAVPVFADLGRSTYNLDVEDVQRRITPKTKAIIAVHLGGNPCDLDALKAVAERHNLVLIEDCAQAWGAKYRGRPIGTVGHFACFSLQDSKHVTCGDGGIVATSDERFGPTMARFGDKGYDRVKGLGLNVFGTNYRMSEPQAAVAAAQLPRLEKIAHRRSELGNLLTEKIAHIPGILPHQVHPEDRCVYWFYMFRVEPKAFRCNRGEFFKALRAEGVSCASGYIGKALYAEPVFQNHGFFAGRWPVKEMGLTSIDYAKHRNPEAEAILATGIRVTIHEAMTEEYILKVAKAIEKVARYYAT